MHCYLHGVVAARCVCTSRAESWAFGIHCTAVVETEGRTNQMKFLQTLLQSSGDR